MEALPTLANLVLREMACGEEDVFKMKLTELIGALNRLKVQTGSLACLGCGYEHNCSTQGCRLIREAVEKLCGMEWIDAKVELPPDDVAVVRCKDCKHCGFCGKETNLEVMGFYGYCSRGERKDGGADNG